MEACSLCRRRTYKPHEIKWQDIEEEATGKQFVMPCTDKHGRTVVIMRPRHEQSSNPDGQIRFLVYTLEQASKRADASGMLSPFHSAPRAGADLFCTTSLSCPRSVTALFGMCRAGQADLADRLQGLLHAERALHPGAPLRSPVSSLLPAEQAGVAALPGHGVCEQGETNGCCWGVSR